MKTKERIKDIRAQIEVLNQELKMVQDDCPHTETFEEERYWRLNNSSNMKVCCECDLVLMNLDTIFKPEDYE